MMSDEQERAMLPCPFCGSEPDFQDHPKFGPRWFCDLGYEHAVFIGGETEEEAAANWNRRAAVPQAPGTDLIDPDALFVCAQMGAHLTRVKVAASPSSPVAQPQDADGVQATDPLDRMKQIRGRVGELEAEIERLTKEHNALLGTGTVDADDIAWATGKDGVKEDGK
jgi:hypothetical protein